MADTPPPIRMGNLTVGSSLAEIVGRDASGNSVRYPADSFKADVEEAVSADLTAAVNAQASQNYKASVVVATTANVNLASGLVNGAVINGVTLVTGQRVLVKAQTAGAENGIYIVAASGAASRATDADTAAELLFAKVYVEGGSVDPFTTWVNQTNPITTLGTTPLTFVKSGASDTSVRSDVGTNPLGVGVAPTVFDQLRGIERNFATIQAASVNLYDPELASATFGQTYNTTGVLVANANGTASGLIPVTAGHTYTHTIRDAPAAFALTVEILFWNTNGTFNSRTTSGVAGDQRSATFTVPGGVGFVGFNTAYINGPTTNPTVYDFTGLRNRSMLIEGKVPDAFVAYATTTYMNPVRPPGLSGGPLLVQRIGTYLYIRDAFSAREDKVEKFSIQTPLYGTGTSPDYSSSGMAGPFFAFLIPSGTPPATTAAAADAGSVILAVSGDDAPPNWVGGIAQGGNHGFPAKQITQTAHGKTNVDVGSRWNDGAAKEWVLVRVADANTLVITPRLGGTSTSWTYDGTLTGTTLTHVAGATHTASISFSGPTDVQLYPWSQDQTARVYIDGAEITSNGVYRGDKVVVTQTYGIPNPVSVINALIAAVGSSADPVYNSSSYQTQVLVNLTWTWRLGEMATCVYEYYNVQSYAQSQVIGLQASPLWRTGTDKLYLHVPNSLADSGTGLNFSTPVDITAGLPGTIDITTAEWASSVAPPERFASILRNTFGSALRGALNGYSHLFGIGVPATRAAATDEALQISPGGKVYLFTQDAAGLGATATAGANYSVLGYRGFFDGTADQNILDQGVYTLGDKQYWVIDIGAPLTKQWIKPPFGVLPRLVGKRVSVTGNGDKSSTLTLHSDVISARGVLVTTTGTHSWMRAEIS